jgi:hypothetical protein
MSFVVAAASHPTSIAGAEVGSNGLGPPRKPATAAVAVSFVVVFVVVAFAPTSVAGGSSGHGSSRRPAAATVVMSFVIVSKKIKCFISAKFSNLNGFLFGMSG